MEGQENAGKNQILMKNGKILAKGIRADEEILKFFQTK